MDDGRANVVDELLGMSSSQIVNRGEHLADAIGVVVWWRIKRKPSCSSAGTGSSIQKR